MRLSIHHPSKRISRLRLCAAAAAAVALMASVSTAAAVGAVFLKSGRTPSYLAHAVSPGAQTIAFSEVRPLYYLPDDD